MPTHSNRRRLFAPLGLVFLAATMLSLWPTGAEARRPRCRLRNMRLIDGKYCIDRYESSTQVRTKRGWRYHSPYESVRGLNVRAVSRRGRYPQAYISRDEAEAACKRSHKRLCTAKEWVHACKGKHPTTYPYGNERKPGRCNDQGIAPLNHFFGDRDGPPSSAYGFHAMNDPRLNKLRGTLAKTGSFRRCRNSYGLYDMVGNLHEWTAEKSGVFRGGYYLDTIINGEGCDYHTVAHNSSYHDYSTGFRCCADPR